DQALGADRGEALQLEELEKRAVATAASEDATCVAAFLQTMPPRYLVATAPEAVARQARVITQVAPTGAAAHLFPLDRGSGPELIEVLVVAPDRPGLLARLTAMLLSNRLDVQSAQLYSRETADGPQVVDVFIVRRLDDDPGGLERLASRLPRDLASVL